MPRYPGRIHGRKPGDIGRGGGAGLNARDSARVHLVLTSPLTRSLVISLVKLYLAYRDKIGAREGFNVMRKRRLKTSLLMFWMAGC
jgi:hypothetical protein